MHRKTVIIVSFSILFFVVYQSGHKYEVYQYPMTKRFPNDSISLKIDTSSSHKPLKTYSCQNKTKFMFSKNSKTGGTTVASIIAQIATHHHTQEILEYKDISHSLAHGHPNVGYHFAHWELDVAKFEKLFPKRETLWISTVRNVHDQVNSLIRYLKLQEHYYPSNFYKTLLKFKQGDRSGIMSPFLNGGISFMLHQCVRHHDFELFKTCAEKISREFDLIIPINRLNEGLIMLHKLSCLPLSDFAYMKKKISSSDFKMSEQNMTTLLSYHQKAIWFYNRSVAAFNQKFDNFQAQYCSSYNCQQEIGELKEENRKAEESCGVSRSAFDRFSGINLNWEKLKKNDSLAVRCIAYAIDDGCQGHFKLYNKYIRENETDIVKKLANEWIKMTINTSLF